jgi:hypothetical protein
MFQMGGVTVVLEQGYGKIINLTLLMNGRFLRFLSSG